MQGLKFTTCFSSPGRVVFRHDSILLKGAVIDDRGEWSTSCSIPVLDAVEVSGGAFEVLALGKKYSIKLRSPKALEYFILDIKDKFNAIYFDLTTLPHHIWAPTLKLALNLGLEAQAIYAEPIHYTRRNEGFDLSERIQRLKSIPGFASFDDEFEKNFKLITLLGFEGNRFEYVVSKIEPEAWQLFPIIGVPGFQPGFADHVFCQNSVTIEEGRCAQNVRYAAANCPFSLISTLEDIADEDSESLLKIAPLGTKPHALGAFLFGYRSKHRVKYIYDYPVRKMKRSIGLGKVHVYDVYKYLKE